MTLFYGCVLIFICILRSVQLFDLYEFSHRLIVMYTLAEKHRHETVLLVWVSNMLWVRTQVNYTICLCLPIERSLFMLTFVNYRQ